MRPLDAARTERRYRRYRRRTSAARWRVHPGSRALAIRRDRVLAVSPELVPLGVPKPGDVVLVSGDLPAAYWVDGEPRVLRVTGTLYYDLLPVRRRRDLPPEPDDYAGQLRVSARRHRRVVIGYAVSYVAMFALAAAVAWGIVP